MSRTGCQMHLSCAAVRLDTWHAISCATHMLMSTHTHISTQHIGATLRFVCNITTSTTWPYICVWCPFPLAHLCIYWKCSMMLRDERALWSAANKYVVHYTYIVYFHLSLALASPNNARGQHRVIRVKSNVADLRVTFRHHLILHALCCVWFRIYI